MIIGCGKRRIVSYTYGWKIEIEKEKSEKSKDVGEVHWVEDSPAYPATLAQALGMVRERILKDMPDTDIADLPEALKAASEAVQKYMDADAGERK